MDKGSFSFQLLLYTACSLLVVLFVNLYDLFSLLQNLLPKPALTLLPIGATFFAVVLLFVLLKKRTASPGFNWIWLLAGATICLLALAVPDPRFPVKRIHVLEYMGLCCLVRYAMSWRLSGTQLLFFSVLATALFGVHDELLQGIHHQRTYGLRDMLVNGLGALGGGMIYHGAALFEGDSRSFHQENSSDYLIGRLYIGWLVMGVLAFIIPLMGYRNDVLPYWPLLPLSAGLVFWFLYHNRLKGGVRYGCQVVSCLAFLFFFYPVVVNAVSLTFF